MTIISMEEQARCTKKNKSRTDAMASNYVQSLSRSYSYTSFPPIETEVDEVGEGHGILVDQRIVDILEPFRHLYTERKEMFEKIFTGIFHELAELFKKVNSLVKDRRTQEERPRTMTRSLSLGSLGAGEDEMFKVRTIDVYGVPVSNDIGQKHGKAVDDHGLVAKQPGDSDPAVDDATTNAIDSTRTGHGMQEGL